MYLLKMDRSKSSVWPGQQQSNHKTHQQNSHISPRPERRNSDRSIAAAHFASFRILFHVHRHIVEIYGLLSERTKHDWRWYLLTQLVQQRSELYVLTYMYTYVQCICFQSKRFGRSLSVWHRIAMPSGIYRVRCGVVPAMHIHIYSMLCYTSCLYKQTYIYMLLLAVTFALCDCLFRSNFFFMFIHFVLQRMCAARRGQEIIVCICFVDGCGDDVYGFCICSAECAYGVYRSEKE